MTRTGKDVPKRGTPHGHLLSWTDVRLRPTPEEDTYRAYETHRVVDPE